MQQKLIYMVFLVVCSINCFGATVCPLPSPAKDIASWIQDWKVISGGESGNNITVALQDIPVRREFQEGWWGYDSIICTYKFKDQLVPLVLQKSIDSGEDRNYHDWKVGVRWSSGYCDTYANTLDMCRVDTMRPSYYFMDM